MGVHVGNTVSQSAILPGFRVIESQRADAGHAVPDPDAQTVHTVAAQHGTGLHCRRGAAAADGQGKGFFAALLQNGLEVLRGLDLFSVDPENQVSFL